MSGGGVIGRHDIIRDELYFLAGEALTHSSFHVEREVPLKVTCLQKDAQRDVPGRGMADDKESLHNRRKRPCLNNNIRSSSNNSNSNNSSNSEEEAMRVRARLHVQSLQSSVKRYRHAMRTLFELCTHMHVRWRSYRKTRHY